MLKDVNKQQLQDAKNHAIELVQDIEAMQDALTSSPDDVIGIRDFAQVKFDAFQNHIQCAELLNTILEQAWIGTAQENKKISV